MRSARSAATSASRCRRTSSTARIRRSPPRARSRSSFPSSPPDGGRVSATGAPQRPAEMPARTLTLASRSPQRRAILTQLGVEFRVVEPDEDEIEHGPPDAMVVENARRKAGAVAGDFVLGVDTTVVLDGRSYGKPVDEQEAAAMLRRLSGREH